MNIRRGQKKHEGRQASWYEHLHAPVDGSFPETDANSTDDVVGRIGLVLVVILAGVFAINLFLIALHVQ